MSETDRPSRQRHRTGRNTKQTAERDAKTSGTNAANTASLRVVAALQNRHAALTVFSPPSLSLLSLGQMMTSACLISFHLLLSAAYRSRLAMFQRAPLYAPISLRPASFSHVVPPTVFFVSFFLSFLSLLEEILTSCVRTGAR